MCMLIWKPSLRAELSTSPQLAQHEFMMLGAPKCPRGAFMFCKIACNQCLLMKGPSPTPSHGVHSCAQAAAAARVADEPDIFHAARTGNSDLVYYHLIADPDSAKSCDERSRYAVEAITSAALQPTPCVQESGCRTMSD
jgi:hypothetical protein